VQPALHGWATGLCSSVSIRGWQAAWMRVAVMGQLMMVVHTEQRSNAKATGCWNFIQTRCH
jgi:hypothetical protein